MFEFEYYWNICIFVEIIKRLEKAVNFSSVCMHAKERVESVYVSMKALHVGLDAKENNVNEESDYDNA